MKRWLLVASVVTLALLPSTSLAADSVRVISLPGTMAFPESIGADPRTGEFFTGSLLDGSMARGSISTLQTEPFLPAGSDGRTSVAGVKVDGQSRVWVADGFGGRVLVYSEAGELLHSFVLRGPGSPVVNDLAFSHGFAYVTDSARPFLYRIDMSTAAQPGATDVEPWLTVEPPVSYQTGDGPFGINLNGIVASADGQVLLSNQTNTGILWRIDVATGAIAKVDVSGADLQFGDGMLQTGDALYVVRNAASQLVKLRLGPGWMTATAELAMTNPHFAFPTAIIELRGNLLITNSQLNAAASPNLPFTILAFPIL